MRELAFSKIILFGYHFSLSCDGGTEWYKCHTERWMGDKSRTLCSSTPKYPSEMNSSDLREYTSVLEEMKQLANCNGLLNLKVKASKDPNSFLLLNSETLDPVFIIKCQSGHFGEYGVKPSSYSHIFVYAGPQTPSPLLYKIDRLGNGDMKVTDQITGHSTTVRNQTTFGSIKYKFQAMDGTEFSWKLVKKDYHCVVYPSKKEVATVICKVDPFKSAKFIISPEVTDYSGLIAMAYFVYMWTNCLGQKSFEELSACFNSAAAQNGRQHADKKTEE